MERFIDQVSSSCSYMCHSLRSCSFKRLIHRLINATTQKVSTTYLFPITQDLLLIYSIVVRMERGISIGPVIGEDIKGCKLVEVESPMITSPPIKASPT